MPSEAGHPGGRLCDARKRRAAPRQRAVGVSHSLGKEPVGRKDGRATAAMQAGDMFREAAQAVPGPDTYSAGCGVTLKPSGQ